MRNAILRNHLNIMQQRLYYRRDRGFHFLNFHSVADNPGYFQFIQGGYLEHSTDAGSFARLPDIGFRQQLHVPRNAYLLADGGYPSNYPLLTPFRRQRGILRPWQRRVNREIARARVLVEQKCRAYRSVPGRAGRFRNRRHFLPIVVKVVTAFVNRRQRLIETIRRYFMDFLVT